MFFAQLTHRESLRDVEVCLGDLGSKSYNMGFRCRVTRSTLADANNRRDSRIWSDFANVLITEARKLYVVEKLAIDFDNVMYAIDSTTISLCLSLCLSPCLSLCPWAKFCSDTASIKLHTQLDHRGNIHPCRCLRLAICTPQKPLEKEFGTFPWGGQSFCE